MREKKIFTRSQETCKEKVVRAKIRRREKKGLKLIKRGEWAQRL